MTESDLCLVGVPRKGLLLRLQIRYLATRFVNSS